MYQREENEVMTIDLSALTDDGDAVDIGEGRTLRLRIESDDLTIDDVGSDWYGAIAWTDERVNDYGWPRPRPDGFDGNAEKLHIGRSHDACWWQPPADVKRGTDGFDSLRSALRDILEYGYYSYGVELLEGVDAYGRPIVENAAWLGGIEPFPDGDYVAELVAELGVAE